MSKQSDKDKITALYCRLSRDDENEGVSGSIKKAGRNKGRKTHGQWTGAPHLRPETELSPPRSPSQKGAARESGSPPPAPVESIFATSFPEHLSSAWRPARELLTAEFNWVCACPTGWARRLTARD